MARRLSIFILSLTLYPALASADIITPQTISAGFVTCIPNAGSSCVDSRATTGQWRVVDSLAPSTSGFSGTTNFLDATLTFSYTGGSLVWTWPVISPLFVETNPFPVSLIAQMTSLSFQATLSQTTFQYLQSGDTFVANTPAVFANETSFPPPLAILVDGNNIHPVPEPASLVLLGTGLAGMLWRRGRSRKV